MNREKEYILHGYFNYSKNSFYFWVEIVFENRVTAATINDLREIFFLSSVKNYQYESNSFNIPIKDKKPVYSYDFNPNERYVYQKRFIDCLSVGINQFCEFDRVVKEIDLKTHYSYRYLRNIYRYCVSLLENKNWNIAYFENRIAIDTVKDKNFSRNIRYFCENFPTIWKADGISIYEYIDITFKKILTNLFDHIFNDKPKNISEKHILVLNLIKKNTLTSYDSYNLNEFIKFSLSSMEFVLRLIQNSDSWLVDSGVKINGRFRSVKTFINQTTPLATKCKGFYMDLFFDRVGSIKIFKEIYNNRFSPIKKSLEEVVSFIKNDSVDIMRSGIVVLYPSVLKNIRKVGVSVRFSYSSRSVSKNILNMDTLLDFDWKFTLGDQEIDENEILENLRNNNGYFISNNGVVELDIKKIKEILIKLESKKRDKLSGITYLEALNFEDEDLNVDMNNIFSSKFDTLKPIKRGEINLKNFKGDLRKYQLKGVIFLLEQERAGFGSILADDMGLGKTIQIIALTLSENRSDKKQSLIVVPTTVLYNWDSEFSKFAPSISRYIHYGTDREKDIEKIKSDIILTTYGVLKKDIEKLSKIKFKRVVIDEAQSIKNPRSDQALAVKALDSESRIALTGTPIENRLMELWSIMDFCNKNLLLSSSNFIKNYEIPIVKHGNEERRKRLKQIISPFVLRRMKSDKSILNDLPEKVESKIYLPLTADQLFKYDLIIKDTENSLNKSGKINKGVMLNTIVKLKHVCNSTLSDSGEIFSTKYIRLKSMIQVIISENNKAIVFSQFVETGKMIKNLLENDINEKVLFFHGSLSVKKREEIVRKFNNSDEHKILILSLRAGGIGLNLTAANYVFHFDRWWNPAVENQAIDRVHRIGQTKKTFVYKFICKGTLEEKIDKIIENKTKLSTDILNQETNFLSSLSKAQFLEIIRR
ncbi:MAG: hypothetical protein CR982_00060 [Candidatus Cloacimonadota bacterium]|nr:MAG: hypothetical protein CR982_00060 [Candidatus Cloacimonadota bacterium]PIE78335.1 MAG: hypothetical protein CSA15_08340 [Candidatus Delongbacteria bacterium]